MTYGCSNCKHCRCYRSNSYWDPDEYECVGFERDLDIDLSQDQFDEIMERCWTNDEQWGVNDEPICPAWEMMEDPDYDYWQEYAWEENHYDKDEAE